MSILPLKVIADGAVDTVYGSFRMDVFAIGDTEVIAIHTDAIPGQIDDVLCRIQSECIAHVFFDETCDCAEQIANALRAFAGAGAGLLIYLRQEGMGLGLPGKLSKDYRDWRAYRICR